MIISTRTTKEQILALIKQNGCMTIMELAQSIGITEMAIRRHIQTLERDELVSSEMKKQTMGRPSKVYQLTELGEDFFPKKYKEFSLDVIQGLKEAGEEKLIQLILQKRKHRLIEKYSTEAKSTTFAQRLEQLRKIQQEEGFMPDMVIEDNIIHFKEYNCPYVEIAKEFTEVCSMERDFFQSFLKTEELTTVSCLASGDSCCHYTIQKNSN